LVTSAFMTIEGQQAGSGAVYPPLVSIVVINRNYAEYIGATIDSIRQQDYPAFECVVVDDCSTDHSLDVVAEHTNADTRFRVVSLKENLGQLAAAIEVLPQLRGNFIVFVDSDDILFPQFISAHIQVHLALPAPVAFTSSNIIEADAEARVMVQSRHGFGDGLNLQKGRPCELQDVASALRLATVSDADYLSLSNATAMVPHFHTRWVWAPGTANVYRRSVLDRVLPHVRLTKPYYSCDSYFIRLLHLSTGSAIINRQLSMYRNHDRNMHSVGPQLQATSWMREDRAEIIVREHMLVLQTYLCRADDFNQMLAGNRYWSTLDLLCNIENASPRDYLGSPAAREILVAAFPRLEAVFGLTTVVRRLCERMTARDVWMTLRAAKPSRVFLRLFVVAQLRQFLNNRSTHDRAGAETTPEPVAGAVAVGAANNDFTESGRPSYKASSRL
jgi:glycosyltransferase involved in cell wall biosynthesis